jgi:Glycosyl transferase family 90
VFTSQRWRLCKFVHELPDASQKEMFDVGLTNIPEFLTYQIDINASLAGGMAELIPMLDFQKYKVVMDMDGSAWSARFSTLLCYNSAVMKVEPGYVDNFFYELLPWKHYIPIKNDLSDLLETTAFVLDPANDQVIRDIVATANQWCAERSTKLALMHDMMDTWERYLQLLDLSNPNWRHQWETTKRDLFSSSSNITLVALKQ